MAVLQMEIVIGAVQVGGHHSNKVGAVLEIVALAHFQAGYLCNGILFVGVLQWRGEQAILFHRLGCILGIDAGATQEEEFLYAMGVGFTDDVALYLHVHHDEVRPIEHIGHNAAHKSSRQHHSIRLLFIKELLDSILIRQVQLLVAPANKVGDRCGLLRIFLNFCLT